ncbi:MAG TPA: alpha/beta fold hydrolase [Rubrivivax sp.]|nr:alpha/beta fold hydrolase [Rubrivivax sp.]
MATAMLALWGASTAGVAAAAAEGETKPVPVEHFFQRPAVLDVKLSPSGKRLALTTSRGANRVGLVVIELTPTIKAKHVGAFNDADITHFNWVGDDRLVFSVVDLEAGSGEDRRYAPGLFAVDADGSAFRLLIKRQGTPFFGDGSRRNEGLEWFHQLLHVPLPQEGVNPDEVLIGVMDIHGNDLRGLLPQWLNTRSGRTRSVDLGDAPKYVQQWMFDSKGQPRLAMTRDKGRSRVHWRGPGDTQWRVLSDEATLHQRFAPNAVTDDGTLYVTRPEGPEGTAVLARFDFTAMAPAQHPMVRTPGFDFRGHLIQDRPGSAVGIRIDTDGETTVWFDEQMKRVQAMVDERLPGRINRIECRRCGAPDMVALVFSYADRDPGRLLLYEAAGQRWQLVSSVLENIDPRRMASVDFQRIKARDGRDLPVWLTLPPGVPRGQPAPAVVLVHGGPWVRGGFWRWQPMEQFLASRGYLVISPEFRGSTGYGQAHYRAGWKQWGQAMQDDVADALQWAQKQGLADKRACIAGASYGGYSALMGLVRDPALYRCGAAWAAVTDPLLILQGSWWIDDDTSSEGRRHTLLELVGDPVKDIAALTAASPLAQAKRIEAPLLLAFGESDRRVPLAHGERLRSALKEAGRPPEWVTYPNEGHSWRQLSTNVDFARRLEKFLATHLRDARDAPPR